VRRVCATLSLSFSNGYSGKVSSISPKYRISRASSEKVDLTHETYNLQTHQSEKEALAEPNFE
jgi:hypothetical protein